MAVWRSRDNDSVEATPGRRRIDLVVYDDARPVALVETESDLNDLRIGGTSRRSGHYDVFSIARSAHGRPFDSYKSLERMAAAAFYWYRAQQLGGYPSPQEGVALLEGVRSDSPEHHNPGKLGLFLVSGTIRPQDRGILDRRLRALGAQLLCGRVSRG